MPTSPEASAPAAPSRRRVLLLIKCLGYGGAERLLVDMTTARDANAFDYEVAYVLRREDALVPAVRASGVPVHCLGARGNWDVSWLWRLRRLLDVGHFDLVHSHLPFAATLGRLVAMTLPSARRPVLVYTEHSMWDKMSPPLRVLNGATVGLEQAVVAVSEPARSSMPPSLRARARVVVHGVDRAKSLELVHRRSEVRRAVRAELEVPDDELLVVTVANLRPKKGYDVLLEATRLLGERRCPLRVVSVGRGPLRESLEAERQRLDLGDRFRFLGQRDDALRLVAASDVFVLASEFEGLPVALMEATSVGAAIVASDVGAIPDVLDHGRAGVLVPPGRPEELADAIAALAADEKRRARLSCAALERSARFDIAEATAKIEDLYRELLTTRR